MDLSFFVLLSALLFVWWTPAPPASRRRQRGLFAPSGGRDAAWFGSFRLPDAVRGMIHQGGSTLRRRCQWVWRATCLSAAWRHGCVMTCQCFKCRSMGLRGGLGAVTSHRETVAGDGQVAGGAVFQMCDQSSGLWGRWWWQVLISPTVFCAGFSWFCERRPLRPWPIKTGGWVELGGDEVPACVGVPLSYQWINLVLIRYFRGGGLDSATGLSQIGAVCARFT